MPGVDFVSLTLCPYDADILASWHIVYSDCQDEGVNRNLGCTVLTVDYELGNIGDSTTTNC